MDETKLPRGRMTSIGNEDSQPLQRLQMSHVDGASAWAVHGREKVTAKPGRHSHGGRSPERSVRPQELHNIEVGQFVFLWLDRRQYIVAALVDIDVLHILHPQARDP